MIVRVQESAVNDAEWEQFFQLLTKIVSRDDMTSQQRAELFLAKMAQFNAQSDCEKLAYFIM